MSMTGGCLCGAVRFEAEDVSNELHVCHCGTCRGWSGGGGFAVSVGSVTFTGEDSLERYASSAWAERGFCRSCGTHLFYHLHEPSNYVMWLGAFDDQTGFSLTQEIYVDRKPAGFALAGDHERLTEAEFMASIGMPPPEA